jgi:hypothetical protein
MRQILRHDLNFALFGRLSRTAFVATSRSAFSVQRSAFSGQRSAVSVQRSAVSKKSADSWSLSADGGARSSALWD